MKCGVSTACFYPMETRQALMEIGKNNIHHAEIFLNTYSEVTKEYATELREIADFYDIEIVSCHPFTCAFEPFMFFTDYEQRFLDALESYRPFFEAMNILGAKIFVFHGDRAASSCSNEKYYDRFSRLREVGREYGVIVAQENVERCKSHSLEFLCEMADYFNGDLQLVFDNKQAVRSGIEQSLFIKKLGKYIIHAHLSDNGIKGDCLPFGKGELDIARLIRELTNEGFNGSGIVELYRESLNSEQEIIESYNCLLTVLAPNLPKSAE